jgi:3-oxoacyl-[acyl-carrier-protein] synthase II
LASVIEQALKDSGIESATQLGSTDAVLIVGTTIGDEAPQTLQADQPIPVFVEEVTHRAAHRVGFRGQLLTIGTACAAGNYAIARAGELLEAGRVDLAIAAGVDLVTPLALAGFESLRALSPDLCRPFDQHRRGLVLGEGAAAVVLVRPADGVKMRARADVLGWGLSVDGHAMVQPDPAGSGAARAMSAAQAHAGISRDEIDYISAHGTGTPGGDLAEARAIHAVFGPRAHRLPVSSIKAQLGHTLGAASLIEAVVCVQALADQTVPATCHVRTLDPECGLDVVPNEPRRASLQIVMSNAFAFGGHNSAIVIGNPIN